MSRYLSDVAITGFTNEVKQAYQGGGKLRKAAKLRTGVKGDTYKFNYMSKGTAVQRAGPSSDITPMDVDHDFKTATLANWDASEYTDLWDKAEVLFDEVAELAATIAMALGRREDQLIIDALNAETTLAGTVGNDIGGTNSNLNMDKVRRAKRYLDAQGVPSTDRHIAVSAYGLESMLGETEATSSDYNSVKALVQGELNTYVGFTWTMIEDRSAEGGLPLSGTDRKCFVWHKDAIGLAVGIDISARVDWVPQKKSWLSTGTLKAGSVSIDGYGIVEIETVEA